MSVEKKSTRQAYGEVLAELGEVNENIVVLDADLSGSTKTAIFAKKFPERFFNAGIAEGNMIGVAAGLAAAGKTVFASSFAMFAVGRAFEQIRNSVAYPNLNVKICASHSGLTVGEDGATHQTVEDISIMRSLPNMAVISPADAVEAVEAVRMAEQYKGPVYIRLGRSDVPVVYDKDNYKFEFGKGITLKEGNDVTIIATGIMVHESLEAAKILEAEGINARIIDIHTIKPIDKDIIIKAAKETKGIITAEEHSIIGGLGSAVAEVLAEEYPAKLTRIGVKDKFGCSGKPRELLEKYEITANDIVKAAKNIIK